MNMEEEEFSPYGAFSSGCDIHGEDYLRECTMCGIEFCAACFPNSALCSDCAAQGDLDLEEEEPASEEDKDLLLLDGLPDEEGGGHPHAPAPGPHAPPTKTLAANPTPALTGQEKPAPTAKAAKPAAKPAAPAKSPRSARPARRAPKPKAKINAAARAPKKPSARAKTKKKP